MFGGHTKYYGGGAGAATHEGEQQQEQQQSSSKTGTTGTTGTGNSMTTSFSSLSILEINIPAMILAGVQEEEEEMNKESKKFQGQEEEEEEEAEKEEDEEKTTKYFRWCAVPLDVPLSRMGHQMFTCGATKIWIVGGYGKVKDYGLFLFFFFFFFWPFKIFRDVTLLQCMEHLFLLCFFCSSIHLLFCCCFLFSLFDQTQFVCRIDPMKKVNQNI